MKFKGDIYNSIKNYQIPRTKCSERCPRSLQKQILKFIWKYKWQE